jgi:hypothetical protein
MGLADWLAATRTYGRVDEDRGEYAETEFLGLGPLPLTPVRSFWITHDGGGPRSGFPIKLHGWSVAAVYLRFWLPCLMLPLLISRSFRPDALVIAVGVACAASLWSWSWWPRGEAARRRSDYDLITFGSRCDPARMKPAMTELLRHRLELHLAGQSAVPPTSDGARLAASEVNEALVAYGLLRLAAVRSSRWRGARRSDELIATSFATQRPSAAPYRGAPEVNALELGVAIETAVQLRARAARSGAPTAPQPDSVPQLGLFDLSLGIRPWLRVSVLVASTLLAGALYVAGNVESRFVAAKDLATLPIGHFVTVDCQAGPELDQYDRVDVTQCDVGSRRLAVVSDVGDGIRSVEPHGFGGFRGLLKELPSSYAPDFHTWTTDHGPDFQRDPRYYKAYLDQRYNWMYDLRGFAIALGLVVLTGWVTGARRLWNRRLVRAGKRAARGAGR